MRRPSEPPPPPDLRMLRRFLAQVLDPSVGPLELRIISGCFAGKTDERIEQHLKYGTMMTGWFSQRESLIAWAAKLHGISGNLCFNPADPALLGRVANEIKKCKEMTTDEDIVVLRWMFVDVDAGQKSGTSATQEQYDRAVGLRDRILADHPEMARSAHWGSSGNGQWILVRLPDYPNDAEHRAIVHDAIKSLAATYVDLPAHVDPGTFNPSKTGSLPGTAKCKGTNRPEQPWRLATYEGACGVSLPPDPNSPGQPWVDEPRPEPFDLKAWVAAHPAPVREARPSPPTAQGGLTGGAFPRDQRLRRAIAYVAEIEGAYQGGLALGKDKSGSDQTFDVACALIKGFDLSQVDAWPILQEYNRRCVPPWEVRDLSHKLEDADAKEDDRPRGYLLTGRPEGADGQAGGVSASGRRFAIDGRPMRNCTDLGNSERLVDMHGQDLRYCQPWRKWLAWDGRRWAIDNTGEVRRRANDTVRNIYMEAALCQGDENADQREALAKHAIMSEKLERRKAMIEGAADLAGIPVLPDDLLGDPWTLNVANGTIDLRTGSLRSARREDMNIKLCNVAYNPTAQCPHWESSLNLFFSGNQDVIKYFKRLCGCAIAGKIQDHVFAVLWGDGSNGKSTILETLISMLGPDYAMKAPKDLISAVKRDSHPTVRAALFGKRLVATIESNEGERLDETGIKELTGGDRISCRRMREDLWDFIPTHTLFLATNHLPVVEGIDGGIWRRMHAIHMAVDLEGDQVDLTMGDKLREEFPGILKWCVEGCLEWQRLGSLKPPKEIVDATTEYRKEQDVVGQFLDEVCDRSDPGARISPTDLYQRYRFWAEDRYETPMTLTSFGKKAKKKLIKEKSAPRWYTGVRITLVKTPVVVLTEPTDTDPEMATAYWDR